jgi:hypothetical protein
MGFARSATARASGSVSQSVSPVAAVWACALADAMNNAMIPPPKRRADLECLTYRYLPVTGTGGRPLA